MDASKMSKSKGNVVFPRPIANMLGRTPSAISCCAK